MNNELMHYGIIRRSGRYPWGSSNNEPGTPAGFIAITNELKAKGLTEVQIAEGLGMNTAQLRQRKSLAKAEVRAADQARAARMKEHGYSNMEIGRRMGINESSVRALLNPSLTDRANVTNATATMLKDSMKESPYLDIGAGTEAHIGISRTKLKTAVAKLRDEEGYKVHYIQVDQMGTSHKTSIMVLAPPDSTYSEVVNAKDQIRMPGQVTSDGGRTYPDLGPIKSVDGKRVYIRYGDEGGTDRDGVVELRRGVDDISLGEARYAQVRIGVDDKSYMKGMAMYSDNIPKGYDMVYNTNKPKGTPPEKVYKPMSDDPNSPFGATVTPKMYTDKDGNEVRSTLNIVNEEGSWGKWSKSISSQVLSKQSPTLAKQQLAIAYDAKKAEFDEIMSLTNPIIKQKMLDEFADSCDSAAVHLKAAAMPRQASHVILPIPSLKEGEIYAPNYRNGEEVVLIRHPHGGTFEIPTLRVNNKHPDAKSVMGGAIDAVGIHPQVAERLSGADFDGDSVLVIPNPKGRNGIKTTPALNGLKDFDPKAAYPAYEGMAKMSSTTKGRQMGDVSNLITDMTIQGANEGEIARAVRHSMVVIDAEKHNLNWKQSAIDNGIPALKEKYQGKSNAGASTLISKASSEQRVNLRKEITPDPTTGAKRFIETGESYVDRKGRTVMRTQTSSKMAETTDAFTLSSGTAMENVYAAHANRLKALGNETRKASLAVKNPKVSPSAKEAYAPEVASLKQKLNVAVKNKPIERQAQLLANTMVAEKVRSNPSLSGAELKKIKGRALETARQRTGANKIKVTFTDREWEAVQSNALSTNVVKQLLDNADSKVVKQLATPRTSVLMNSQKKQKAATMATLGYTQAEIADALGVSLSTLQRAI